MFQPISFNVIRQALDWHGFPVPKLRQLSSWHGVGADLAALYLATWTFEQVINVVGFIPTHVGSYGYDQFRAELTECFCQDVTIVGQKLDHHNRRVAVKLYVVVSGDIVKLEKSRVDEF